MSPVALWECKKTGAQRWGKERVSLLFGWGINTERWVVHSQVAGTKVIFEGGRLGSFATPGWSEKDGVGGFFLLRTFDTMGQFIQEIFGAEIGEVERGHGLLRFASARDKQGPNPACRTSCI